MRHGFITNKNNNVCGDKIVSSVNEVENLQAWKTSISGTSPYSTAMLPMNNSHVGKLDPVVQHQH